MFFYAKYSFPSLGMFYNCIFIHEDFVLPLADLNNRIVLKVQIFQGSSVFFTVVSHLSNTNKCTFNLSPLFVLEFLLKPQ